VAAKDRHLGIETPWPGIYACGDWVWDPAPPLYLERATVTGIKAANLVLREMECDLFEVESYPNPEPFAAWIEKIMRSGRALVRRKK
jgi:hypothetical protein